MPQFTYKAVNPKGAITLGASEAVSLEALTATLKQQDLFLMECKDSSGNAASSVPTFSMPRMKVFSWFGKKINSDDVAIFTSEFAVMVKSGLPIAQALRCLAFQQTKPRFKDVLLSVCGNVQEGISLSQAFARLPKIFDQVYISLLMAGEDSGNLSLMLERIASYLIFKRDLKSRVQSTVFYPLIIVCTTLGVLSFIVLFVLPTFADVFADFEIALPLPTRMLLATGTNVRSWWYLYLGGLITASVYAVRWFRNPVHEKRVDVLKLTLPVIGPLTRNVVMTRVLRTLSALVSSGVPILKSLSLARASAGNWAFRSLLDRVYVSANSGKGLAGPLRADPYFPESVANMIGNAETMGSLPEVLTKVCDYYERETEATLRNAFSILEPILIICMGVMVAIIALCVLLPIMTLDPGAR